MSPSRLAVAQDVGEVEMTDKIQDRLRELDDYLGDFGREAALSGDSDEQPCGKHRNGE